MIIRNLLEVESVKLGNVNIDAIYLGSIEIWLSVRSSFGAGYWQNDKPWLNDEAWKNN